MNIKKDPHDTLKQPDMAGKGIKHEAPKMGPGGPKMIPGGPRMGPAGPGMGMGPSGRGTGFRMAAFSSLKIRSFRWLWFGNFFAFNSMQMQMVARGWLVYTMTNSPLALGLVSAGFGLPMLMFSLFGGTVADRVRKRNLLLVTQSFMGVMSLIITLLIQTELIALWHLFMSSFFAGVIFSFMMPARQAFLVELVDEKDYLNAISLGSMAMNMCRIGSPALAGVLLKIIGIPGVYWIVTISYVGVILTTTKIPPGEHIAAKADAPMMADILEGLRYVKGNRIIITLLVMSFVPILLAMPYQMLMPVFARTIFKAGETGLGLLMSATGVGALIGSMITASLGDFQRKGILMLMTGAAFGFFLMPFALSGSLVPASIFLLAVGTSSSIFMSLNTSLLMSNTPVELIGRVMSIFMMTFGLMPLGTVPSGALAEIIGVPLTVAGGGAVLFLFIIVLIITQPIIRQLK